MANFSKLFKKYRLRSEFETISAFSDALSEKGYFYDESIFYHWQKGTRIPNNRELLLTLIKIFTEKGAMHSLKEANEFLESTQQGYLTNKEARSFYFEKNTDAEVPFQVPSEIAHFTGREEVVKKIQKDLKQNNTFLIHGAPGVGKTALAIKLGHLLKSRFPDGVLWYKVDSTNVMDILLSIAHLYGEDISEIKDIEVRASIVRTLLSNKKVLLIFDNVTEEHSLKLLLLNSSTSSIIFTSQESSHAIPSLYTSFQVYTFTYAESKALFENIFNKSFIARYAKQINELSIKLGNLPLALQMAANFIKQSDISPQDYIEQLNDAAIDLHEMKYEDKSLFRAITISFDTLDEQTKILFISLGIFEGKDFSWEAVAFVNKLSERNTKHRLKKLIEISLVEESNNQRYRIHPLIKIFLRKQMKDSSIYLRAAQYYEKLLIKGNEKTNSKSPRLEVDNIIYIFKQCYESSYWDQVITMWNPIEKFLSDNNEVKKLGLLTKTIDTAPNINLLQKIITALMILLIFYWLVMIIFIRENSFWGELYSLLYTFIPLTAGSIGVYKSKAWGFFNSNIGKAIFFISLGLLSWGSGNIIWAYYNFFQEINIPYPSLADIGYFPAYFCWIAGITFLSKATGTKFSFKENRFKIILLCIPMILFIFSYYFLFFIVERSFDSYTPLRILFDIYYPSMNIVILTISTIIFGLSVNFFGGKYKLSIFSILSGFIFLYAADFMFSYTTSTNVFYNGNIDVLFMISFCLISLGTLSFYITPKRKVTLAPSYKTS